MRHWHATGLGVEVTLKLLLMGTGEFARPTFRALVEGPHQVVGLVTQPDRGGAGQHDHCHPLESIKSECIARGIAVLQPETVNSPESIAAISDLSPDLAVVAAYGQILRPELIAVPRLGAVNLHASLLPRHRGATPIHHAILSGDTRTGVSLFQIEPAVDTGPVLGMVEVEMSMTETTGELHDRLSELAVGLAGSVVDALDAGTAVPLVQDDSRATVAPRLRKSDAEIDWSGDAASIDRHVRAMRPWPNPFTFLHQGQQAARRLIVHAVEAGPDCSGASVGEVIVGEGIEGLVVGCGGGTVRILRLQPEGRRAMDSGEFLRGTGSLESARVGPISDD